MIDPPLIDLLLDEKNKVPDASGNTPLVKLALVIRSLDIDSDKKMMYVDEVSRIVQHFKSFNQTHLAELDSFISTANLPTSKIIQSFSSFIKKVEPDENIFFKACVLRFIQSHNKALFQLDYIKQRFNSVRDNDPWLYAELILAVNWQHGVELITEILKNKNDTSYLFPLITYLMSHSGNEELINGAFRQWYKFLSGEDQQLLLTFSEQYGFNIPSEIQSAKSATQRVVLENYDIILEKFAEATAPKKYETLKSQCENISIRT